MAVYPAYALTTTVYTQEHAEWEPLQSVPIDVSHKPESTARRQAHSLVSAKTA